MASVISCSLISKWDTSSPKTGFFSSAQRQPRISTNGQRVNSKVLEVPVASLLHDWALYRIHCPGAQDWNQLTFIWPLPMAISWSPCLYLSLFSYSLLCSVHLCNIRYRHFTSCKRGGWCLKTTVTQLQSFYVLSWLPLYLSLKCNRLFFFTTITQKTHLNNQ